MQYMQKLIKDIFIQGLVAKSLSACSKCCGQQSVEILKMTFNIMIIKIYAREIKMS